MKSYGVPRASSYTVPGMQCPMANIFCNIHIPFCHESFVEAQFVVAGNDNFVLMG